jgi:hypothetical protein
MPYKDLEQNRKRCREYRQKHLEELRDYDRLRNNTEKRKQWFRERDQKRERKYYKKQQNKKYRQEHKEELAEYNKGYQDKNKAQLQKYFANRYYTLKEKVFVILGSECSNCGCNDKRILQVDHVNGHGYSERKTSKKIPFKNIEKNPEKYQILCPNCNWIKKSENMESKPRLQTKRAEQKRERYYAKKRKAFDILGNKCVHCGNTDHRALQIDHVNGNGHKELRQINLNGVLNKILAEEKEEYQLLCANCNWKKRYDKQEYFIKLAVPTWSE